MKLRGPNFRRIGRKLQSGLGRRLHRAGVQSVLEAVSRINAGVDRDGRAQKANSTVPPPGGGPSYAERKRRIKGHVVPLRYDDVLSDPQKWLINGTPALASSAPTSWPFKLVIEPPRDRQAILGYLRARGYRPPWGLKRGGFIHDKITLNLRTLLSDAWRRGR